MSWLKKFTPNPSFLSQNKKIKFFFRTYKIYTINNSTLSRLAVYSDGDLDSDYYDGVDCSGVGGRVVVVPREASAQILDMSLEELEELIQLMLKQKKHSEML